MDAIGCNEKRSTSIIQGRDFFEVDTTEIEDIIKECVQKFAASHILPYGEIIFDHKKWLPKSTSVKIYISFIQIADQQGNSQINVVVLPQGVDRGDLMQAYVVAICKIEKPRTH